jgi:hypothetical protein
MSTGSFPGSRASRGNITKGLARCGDVAPAGSFRAMAAGSHVMANRPTTRRPAGSSPSSATTTTTSCYKRRCTTPAPQQLAIAPPSSSPRHQPLAERHGAARRADAAAAQVVLQQRVIQILNEVMVTALCTALQHSKPVSSAHD